MCQFQFPEQYPEMPILMEIKSKVFSVKVTKLLNDRCDEEAKKLEGRAQVKVLWYSQVPNKQRGWKMSKFLINGGGGQISRGF